MIFTQSDIKAQIKAARANENGITKFSTEVTEQGNLVKKFECTAYTKKDKSNDIYPYIVVRYEQGENYLVYSYSLQQLKEMANDLTNFTQCDEYINKLILKAKA